MINQSKREEIIKLLDKSSDNVNLEDLFLYDLSPYYEEKNNNSFFSKQLEYLKEKNLLKYIKSGISFTPEQKKIYNEILADDNTRLIISAPTSFGKTMLIKEYIYNQKPQKIVFLVPTNSLADELIDDFYEIFKELDYTIFDTVREGGEINQKSIFIGTQEKYYQIYQNYNIEIDLFVIDEAYKLSDKINGSREVILNRTFIDTISKAKKVILLLPLVNKINGIDVLNFKILKSDYAPVAKNFLKLEKNKFDSYVEKKINDNAESNLVYFNSPKDAEDFFIKKIDFFQQPKILSDSWLERVQNDFHSEWVPLNALKNGIGIHYGPMPKFIQKKVIELFNEGAIKTVLATSSVIEGVNTPTKNIFISTSRDILGSQNVIKFKNLIGRAGRLGIHKVGNVYYKDIHTKEFNRVNIPFEDINLNFIIDTPAQIVEINRESEYKSFTSDSNLNKNDNTYEFNRTDTINYLDSSFYGKVPFEKISDILNSYGFTIKQYKDLIEYSKNKDINLFGILGKLKSSDSDIYSINAIVDIKFESITDMVNELSTIDKFKKIKTHQLVSIVIKMIYNTIPHKIIPALDFIIELNDIYIEYNKKELIARKNINEAKFKKVQFYNKFIGEDVSKIEESKKIMSKLFEYGIPYFRVKKHFNKIVSLVPDNFSIYDIKGIIYQDNTMEELRIYFE